MELPPPPPKAMTVPPTLRLEPLQVPLTPARMLAPTSRLEAPGGSAGRDERRTLILPLSPLSPLLPLGSVNAVAPAADGAAIDRGTVDGATDQDAALPLRSRRPSVQVPAAPYPPSASESGKPAHFRVISADIQMDRLGGASTTPTASLHSSSRSYASKDMNRNQLSQQDSSATLQGDDDPFGEPSRAEASAKAAHPARISKAAMAVTFSAISMIGLNDSATGALLPELEIYYHLPKDILSIVFLANVFGYLLSCVFSTPLEFRLGTRMTLMLSSASYVVATILMLITPPFPVVVIALSLLGFGSGLFDAVLSSVTSHYIAEGGPGYVMSFLYAAFGVGATAAPFVVGGILDGGASWQYYYVLPLAMTVVNGALIMYYFRNYTMPPDEPEYKGNGSAWQRMATVVRMRPIQIAFGLFVVAFTTTDMISAWAVTWLRDVRGIEGGMAQYYLSFFWAGIAVGRIGLSWFAHRRGWSTKYSSMCFVSIMGALVLVMFFVPNRPLTAALMALSGFFLGPCTPAVLYAIGQVVTPSQRSASVSLVISVGLAGSAISPLVYGVVAKQSGLTSLPIVIVVLCAISCLLWLIFPERRSSRRDE